MSKDKVIVEVEMIDAKKSMDSLENGGKRVNKTLERTQELMKGTKGGSRAANAAFQQTEYDRARGTAGTGAGGRDFAKQSRELDGLVRLYAVYAANIFAAGAAFRALSEAMDTTNMIQGLNQLGAASGVAMGGLAKRFSEASGGAISLRESMEATAKAVSSGLSQTQFLKLGEVAKKASQALGVNMSDAVSRLTRGITKLEPELLDELGIFTKVGQATEDYARAIGKPAAALTDFEKRQAFANAVLAEGAKKFGQIDIPTNPYDKLLATLKNVAQMGLEIVNNVLGPFANLLSKNTGLLVGVLGLIGAKIVKDALPAIGQWRAGLKSAADEAKKRSSDIAASFGEGFVERTNAAFKIPELESNLKKSEDAYRESRAKMATMDTDFSKRVLKGGPATDEKSLRSEQTRITKELNKLKNAGLAADNAQIVALEKQKAIIVDLKNARKNLTDAQDAALNKAGGGSLGERAGDFFRTSAAKSARNKSQRLETLSNVSTMQREQGFSPAMALLKKDLEAVPNWINKARTGIAGVVIAGAGAVGTAIAGLSAFLAPVVIFVGLLQTMLPFMRKNEEEAARFAESLDLLKENAENSFRVLERISKLDPLERLSIDSINAKSTALEGIGGSLTKAYENFQEEINNRNGADTVLNFMAAFIGQSSEQKFAKAAASSIQRALSLAIGERQEELKSEITTLLGVPAQASFVAIAKAYNAAKPELKTAVNKLIEDSGKEATRSVGSFKSFRDSLAESGKVYQDLINTFKNSTPLGKFAEDSSKKILELGKLISDDKIGLTEQLSGLQEVAGRIDFLQLFPAEAAGNILQTSRELSKLKDELAQVDMVQKAYNETIGAKTDAKTELENLRAKDPVKYVLKGGSDKLAKVTGDIQSINNASKNLDLQRKKIQDGLNSATQVFSIAMRDGLLANIKTFTEGLRDAAARAGLELRKVATEGMADPKLRNKETANIERAGLALDRNMLKVQESLINSNAQLKLAIMENTLAIGLSKPGAVQPGESVEQALARPENKPLAIQQAAITTFRDNMNAKMGDIERQLKDQKSYRTGPNAGMIEGLGQALNTAQARAALEAEFAKIQGKVAGVNLKEKFGDIDADKGESLRVIAAAQKRLDQDQQRLDQTKATMGEDDFKAAQLELITNKANLDYATKIIEANAIVLKSKTAQAATGTQIGISDVGYAQQLFDLTDKQARADRDIAVSGAKQAADTSAAVVALNAAESSRQHIVSLANQELSLEMDMNQAKQTALQTAYNLGFVDEQAFKTKSDILKLEEIRLDQSIKLRAAYEKEAAALAALDQAKAAAGNTLTGSALQEDLRKRKQAEENRKAEVDSIRAVTKAREDDLRMITEADLRQQAYTDAFKNAFKGMEDAIVNFTKTGKLSFKDMINNFGEALLRFEIQASQRALFEGLGGSGSMGKSLASAASSGVDWVTSFFKSAQGSAFDGGVRKFAKGGMFTNSIVSSPTLFKFAQGAGMMGEAGPEAIMPLKRDSNGNLGVRSNQQQGNVDVVVNNYGNEKATTKETTDSQGNRKIEVIIGEMVSKEVSRTGSSTQQAFSTTFGSRPALARR